eukprot:4736247-Pyramimonas_sp.AAC.1
MPMPRPSMRGPGGTTALGGMPPSREVDGGLDYPLQISTALLGAPAPGPPIRRLYSGGSIYDCAGVPGRGRAGGTGGTLAHDWPSSPSSDRFPPPPRAAPPYSAQRFSQLD